MENYTDEKISIEDLNLLRNILNKDKEELEREIIDILGELYILDNEYFKYEDVINKNYKYFVRRIFNPISCLAVAGLALFVAHSCFIEDTPLTYDLYCLLVGTICGSVPLQIFNKRENYVSSEEVVNTYNICSSIESDMESYIYDYYSVLKEYLENKKDFVLEDDMKRMFEKHKEYINSKFGSNESDMEWDFKSWLEFNCDFFDDDLARKRIESLEKQEKQRKR